MNSGRFIRLLVLLAAAAATAGGAAPLLHAEASQEAGSESTSSPPSGAQVAQSSQDQQEPEVELFPERHRVGNTVFIFNDVFDFSGVVNDLFVLGWLPTISGEISDNAFLGGSKVDLTADASIGGDLFIFAQTASIEGQIVGDVYGFANELRVAEGAVVGGAIYGASAIAILDGNIGGPVNFSSGSVMINGTVRGDVWIECGELTLGPNAVIEGDLRYESARPAAIDPGARVLGDTRHDVPQDDDEEEGAAAAGSGWFSARNLLWNGWWLLSSFIVGAVALAIGGETARRPAACLAEQPALGLGFGFVVAVVFPAAAILAIILLVTIPLGVLALALYLAAGYLARLVAAQTVGDWLLRTVRTGVEPSAYASLALGLVLFYVLTQIPYVGFLIWLAALVGGLGGIFLATRSGKGDAVAGGPQPATIP